MCHCTRQARGRARSRRGFCCASRGRGRTHSRGRGRGGWARTREAGGAPHQGAVALLQVEALDGNELVPRHAQGLPHRRAHPLPHLVQQIIVGRVCGVPHRSRRLGAGRGRLPKGASVRPPRIPSCGGGWGHGLRAFLLPVSPCPAPPGAPLTVLSLPLSPSRHSHRTLPQPVQRPRLSPALPLPRHDHQAGALRGACWGA